MKMMKKALSAALAAMLCLSAMGASAFAAADRAGSGVFSYYDQLSANQKAVYHAVMEIDPTEGDGGIAIGLPDPLTYKSDESGDNERIEARFSSIVQGALDALLFDHPEMMWLEKSACTTTANAQAESRDGDLYTWVVDTVQLRYVTVPNGVEMGRAVQQALFTAQGGTRYDQVLDIHDRLCATAAFASGGYEHDAYGALVQGAAVCEGYAKAFKLLCDKAGIPCVLVAGTGLTSKTGAQGENHMWNYVQMEDGKWYAVDTTWDDQGEKIYRDFFLTGSGTVSSAEFGQTAFSQSHMPNGDFSRSGVEFEYPPLSKSRYGSAG